MKVTNEMKSSPVGKTANDDSLFATSEPALGAWPFFADDEIEAAVQVLRSGKVNYWTGNEGQIGRAHV